MAAAADPASLANLQDIVVPEAISWWPLAPGWYGVGALLVMLTVWAGLRGWRRHRRDAYRRQALRELEALRAARGEADGGLLLADVAELLRRVALSAYPRSRVVGLTGEAWLGFLDQTAGGGRGFSGEPGRLLLAAAYRTSGEFPRERVDEVLTQAAAWVGNHRTGWD
jgi:hypothetical protein